MQTDEHICIVTGPDHLHGCVGNKPSVRPAQTAVKHFHLAGRLGVVLAALGEKTPAIRTSQAFGPDWLHPANDKQGI